MNPTIKNILIIEDEEVDRLFIDRFLKKNISPLYTYSIVSNLEEAHDQLSLSHYDVIVSDINLGDGTSGLDLLENAKNNNRPLIFITSNADIDFAINAVKSGAHDYLIKDIEAKFLQKLLLVIDKYFADETKEIQLKKELETANIRFHDMVNLLPQPVFEMDLRGNIKFYNAICTKMSGYSKEEFDKGINITQLLIPEDREQIRDDLNTLITNKGGEKTLVQEYSALTKDFLIFPIILYINVIITDGQSSGFRGMVLDISQQKKSEILIKQAGEEKELYLDILTHDLKNFISSSKGYIDLALLDDSVNENKIFLSQARSTVAKMNTLIKNISIMMRSSLDFSYDLEPINLLHTIKKLQLDLNDVFPDKHINLNHKLDISTNILADSLFEQLLLNLFTNSIKATLSTNNEINIDIETIQNTNGKVFLTISDYGMGISPKERDNLFERYKVFRKTGKGSGLGLFIIKNLIDRYGGGIAVESRDEQDWSLGTKFVIELYKAN